MTQRSDEDDAPMMKIGDAARDIVVDTLDLTAEQREQLTRAIGDGLAGFDDMPTRITILE